MSERKPKGLRKAALENESTKKHKKDLPIENEDSSGILQVDVAVDVNELYSMAVEKKGTMLASCTCY
jgi:hypothetical protein